MTSRYLLVGLSFALAACATSPTQVGDSEDFATIASNTFRSHVRAVRDVVRADRDALRAAFARLGQPLGRVTSVGPAASEAPSESGIDRTAAVGAAPLRATGGHPARDPGGHAIQMEVGPSEMLTSEGTLHPRAAEALGRMDRMAREHGGEFTVSVPRSQIRSASSIREVAPGATILSAEESENYRLIVITGDR